ncbi:hypothetical protein ACJX0J_032421, partial [Zea mays]
YRRIIENIIIIFQGTRSFLITRACFVGFIFAPLYASGHCPLNKVKHKNTTNRTTQRHISHIQRTVGMFAITIRVRNKTNI